MPATARHASDRDRSPVLCVALAGLVVTLAVLSVTLAVLSVTLAILSVTLANLTIDLAILRVRSAFRLWCLCWRRETVNAGILGCIAGRG